MCDDHELSTVGCRRLLEALWKTVQIVHSVLVTVVWNRLNGPGGPLESDTG